MDIEKAIESMNLLTNRLDTESLDGDMKEAVEDLNASLDRIAAVIDEHKKQEGARIVKDGERRMYGAEALGA